jgi:hypothetical protein
MHPDLDRDPALGAHLQKLPEEAAPYGFAEFRRRGGARPQRAFPRLFSTGALGLLVGAAAGLVVAVLGVTWWAQYPGVADPTEVELTASRVAPPPAEAQVEAQESWLASLPADHAVVRLGSRAAVAGLEDRIAQLDDVISAERASRAHPARLKAFEEQRGLLLTSLVQVAYAESLAQGR